MTYYIKDNYYFDIDKFNQLRITGPQNHLLMGLTLPPQEVVTVLDYYLVKEQLVIKIKLTSKELDASIPVVTDIRTIRSFTESVRPEPTFDQLVQLGIEEVIPDVIRKISHGDHFTYKFINKYIDEKGRKRNFGAKIYIPKKYQSTIEKNRLLIKAQEPIELTIKTVTNVKILKRYRADIFSTPSHLSHKLFDNNLLDLYKRSGENVIHLVKSLKTSSFEYGTIFPRDWIESADLGEGDLSETTIDYMYSQAMKYISETGEGWHEETVGSYKLKIKDKESEVDRVMIDIEPRYILGMGNLSKHFLKQKENRRKLRLVANYILRNAEEKELITFKKIKHKKDEYHQVGNWRDSNNAYPAQKPPLAPYDVNCVFYPTGLNIILKYADYFTIKDLNWLKGLISKWEINKLRFRMYHPYDLTGYAIALHGPKNKPLPVAHLDESYDLFYGSPTLEDVVSFARKLADPDFFYTPVGPILVANDEEDYNSSQYHGKVVWPKQAAFAIAGLGKQYRRGVDEGWPKNIQDTLKDVIIKTSESCFKGWLQLGSVPELYYYDSKEDRARFYTDQKEYEGQMSMVQLWSSVGLRRIMREYQYIKKH